VRETNDDRSPSPTGSTAHEAQQIAVAILRAADALRRAVATALAPYGISSQQYNVLRILRGAHPGSLPTLAVGARMIERTPGITRLLDRLESAGLAHRERPADDRRFVECRITESGLRLLAALDAPIDEINRRAVGSLGGEDRASLVRMLGLVRGDDG
jgi:DNA-binding MarR family transcriptional regulator